MKYKTKSAIMGRMGKRDEDGRGPVFVRLFDVNDPHKTDKTPHTFLEFDRIQKIVIKGLDVNYLIGGSDLFINDLQEIDVSMQEGKLENLMISGHQNKA